MSITPDATGDQEKTHDPAMVAFGQLVRERRGKEQVYVLAARSGVPPSSISKVEAGKGGHLLTAVKLARTLGIDSIPVE